MRMDMDERTCCLGVTTEGTESTEEGRAEKGWRARGGLCHGYTRMDTDERACCLGVTTEGTESTEEGREEKGARARGMR